MPVTLTDEEYRTVMKALMNVEHELSFLHGLHVTDVPDVAFTWDIDCIEVKRIIDEAISVLDRLDNKNNGDCS